MDPLGLGGSSIFHAARLGRLGALRHFLRTPGAAAARDDQRRSALHHAAGDGHAALCRVLLEAKAEVDPTDDFDGRVADGAGSWEIFMRFLTCGKDQTWKVLLFAGLGQF